MRHPVRCFFFFLSSLLYLLSSLFVASAHDGRPALLRDLGFEQHLQAQLPLDLVLRDETGRAVQLGEYFGEKPAILVLSYYQCPRLCPLVLEGLSKTLRVLAFTVGQEFDIVTVSIDPRETPELAATTKATYLKRYNRPDAAAGWHFLTGDEGAIQRLAQTVGFRYAYDAEQDQFAHASGLIVTTPEGQLARYFYGIEYAPRDLRLGLVEAAAGTIGSPVDQLLLFCYHYDPLTGQYGLVIMNVIRVAGGMTVVALGTFMGVMLRREKTIRQPRSAGEQ